MQKTRKTSHITNIIQFDADGHVVIPASLTLGVAPGSDDNSAKVPSTAWVRSIVTTAGGAYVPTGRTITINGVSYDLSSNRSWSINTGVLTATAGAGISVTTVSGNLNIVNTGLLTATSGAGISVTTVNQNLNIVNTGLLTATSGAGISVTTVNQNLNIVNTGILTSTAGAGISVTVVDQNLNVVNTGILTSTAGAGISVTVVDQNLNVVNTGLLTATAGSGISISTVNQNLNIVNTGLRSATAGAGISITVVDGNLNIVNTITNNNQLTNGANYATQSYVTTQINNLVSGAPGLLDTLDELAAALGDDPNFATTVTTALSNRLRIDIGTQGLTSTQQGYGRTNLGLGSLATLSSIGDAYITDLAWSKLTGVPATFTPSAHTHDDRYYTETEIANFFSGSSAISGYNKSNWDTAYGWGNHASGGYLTTASAASTYVSLSGSYANPAWITSLAWSKITGTPTTISGYGITNAYTDAQIQNFFNGANAITGYNKSNWDTAYGWGNHASAGYQAASTAITTSNIGSQSVSYATSAGNANTLDSLDSSDFMRNYGMLNNTDVYVNFRVMRNNNSSSLNDGMYIGYGNSNSGVTRIFGGGATSGGINVTGSGVNDVSIAGSTVWNSGNLTNLNQLTNGPGYITSSGSISGSAGSVPWSGVSTGYRTNYDLGFRPADNSSSYAGFRFASPGNDADAGYFLIRGGADSDVYTQNGITLVADLGWLTLAQRTQSNKGVRIMTGTTSTTRLQIDSSGNTDVGLGAGTVTLYHGGASRFWTGSDGTRTQGWAYFQNTSQGLHWPGNNWHLHPASASDFIIRSGSNTDSALRFDTNGTTRGYVYAENDNTIGFLTNSRNWAFRTYSNGNALVYGYLTVNGAGTSSSIYMNDSDNGQREIHCNSDRIGFLTQAGNWGAWLYDGADWEAASSVRAPIFYDSQNTTYYLDPNAATSLNIAGKITTAVSNGTILSHGSMTDAIGYNNSYGTYIGSVVGGTYYIYANGQMYNNGPIVTLLHSSNYTSWAQQKVYQGQNAGDWQNFTNDVGEFRVDEVLNINAGGHSNQPPSVYTYGGVLSWRTNNHSFQLYASHTGDITFKTQWGNDNYSGWRRILHESNYNSWAPSLTGGGASGTWGISITGKSETVTINYNNDSNSTYQLLWGSGNSVYGTSDVWVNPNSDVINARGGFISNGNPWGTSNSAFFPNGITTAGGTNWIYGFTYIGNAPGNGAGHEFYTSGSSYSTGDVEAAGSMRAPIFYDRNDTTYYLDPNSSSRLRYLYVGDGGSNWSNPGGWDTTLYISGVNHSIIRVENRQNNYHSALHSHTGQLPGVGSPGDYDFRITRNWSNRMVFYTGYTYAEGYLQAADSLRAPIFYDSNDTGYYLDPNGASNLQSWTADTAARIGRSRYWTNRWAIYGGLNDHMTGTNGWGMDHGGWDTAWKGGFSGWDIWGTGTGHPQGGGYIHAQGIISGQHAASLDGSSAYGWMMVGAHNATENRYWLRGKWSTSTSGWVEMITTGNIGSQSVSYANTAGRAYPRRSDGADINFYWSGQSGQPTWLWGSNDGQNFYVWNPSNFSVSYANSAGSANSVAWGNVSGRPTGVSSFTNDSGYITSGSNVVGLYSSGFGSGNFTWYQSPGGLAPYTGSWASFLISNHGDGATYYNQTIIMPFWGVPQYMRKEGGTNRGPWTFWTEENYNPSNHGGNYTANGFIRVNANNNLYLDYNHGQSIVGVYSSYRFQGVYSMGDSYKLAIDGTTPGNLYGLSWSHPNAGGQATRLNDHGLMVMINGVTQSAFSSNIWAAGDITAYSDIRVKDNIKTIDNAVQKVKAIRGVTFTRNDMTDSTTRHAGVIAQEILQVLPEVVTKDGNDHYSVAYGNLNALLIEAIKEQQAQIEDLKNQITELKENK